MTDKLKETPLHAVHVANGARMVPFAGFSMPVQYSSIIDEHRAVRECAGLFDVSHMGELMVHGPQARNFLDRLITNDINKLKTGKALYSPICAHDGGVIDDLIIYQLAPERYFVCINASNIEKDFAWAQQQASAFTCSVENVSETWGQLALQGPAAIAILEAFSGKDFSGLRRFHFVGHSLAGAEVMISRTGYTGEDGVEIYAPSESIAAIAEGLMRSGSATGLRWVGLGARDSLRLEAGYPLYGHEISGEIDPLTAGLGWTVKLDKTRPFIGAEALQQKLAAGLSSCVRHFCVEDRRIARDGTAIVAEDGSKAGHVLSGTYSPMLNGPVGSALLDVKLADGAHPLFAEIRNQRVPLRLASPPLHRSQPTQ